MALIIVMAWDGWMVVRNVIPVVDIGGVPIGDIYSTKGCQDRF